MHFTIETVRSDRFKGNGQLSDYFEQPMSPDDPVLKMHKKNTLSLSTKNLNYANYVITPITEAKKIPKKSELRQLRNYINYGGRFFPKKSELRQLRNYANYGGKFFPKKFELRNYVGSEKFFGQKPQLRNYVITQLQKCQNHPFVLPLVKLRNFQTTGRQSRSSVTGSCTTPTSPKTATPAMQPGRRTLQTSRSSSGEIIHLTALVLQSFLVIYDPWNESL